jgi:hypothetical protein
MDPLLAAIPGAIHHDIAGVQADIVAAANGRVQRVIYPPGFRWSTHMKPRVGTERCMHAHVGFLARGHVQGRYGDGCEFEFRAPQAVVLEPGHDAWVVGEEPAVLIQFDCEARTARYFGLPGEHRHGAGPVRRAAKPAPKTRGRRGTRPPGARRAAPRATRPKRRR